MFVLLTCSLVFIALFFVQVLAGKAGWAVANLFSHPGSGSYLYFVHRRPYQMVHLPFLRRIYSFPVMLRFCHGDRERYRVSAEPQHFISDAYA